ncbi:MAG TPA: serine/threonine-protein kinase [Gemmatimonadaceae bacterium]|nr:serine/threonine-protein kinase [Gemmatimonadaceae bacterium]
MSGSLARRYVIDCELGRGGMGVVYLARDIRLQRQVAVKLLVPPLSLSAERRARFLREARLMAGLSHPHIVPVFEFAEEGDVAWFAMDFVRGESVAARMRRDGPLPVADACRILLQVADALDFAHARGITHRDIKPDNILLDDRSGRALLADFGVATAAGRGLAAAHAVGTVEYMAPEWLLAAMDADATRTRESITGDPARRGAISGADATGDVYALGITAFEMLAGRVPFTARNAHAIALQHLTRPAPDLRDASPHVPPSIAAVISRALEKEPQRRWRSARAFADALREAMQDGIGGVTGLGLEREARLGWLDGALARAALGVAALTPYALGVNVLLDTPVSHWRLAAGLALLAAFLPLVAFALALPLLRCHRLPAATLLRHGFRQPRWWLAWWPSSLRRTDTLWPRLPLTVRLGRSAIFFAVGTVALLVPALLLAAVFALAEGSGSALASLVGPTGQLSASAAIVACVAYGGALRWSRKRHLAWAETNDLFLRDVSTPSLRWREGGGDILLPREAA